MVLTFLQSSLPQQLQNSEQDRQAEEQLHRAEEQGCDDAQPHFIIFSMSTGAGDTSGGKHSNQVTQMQVHFAM